MGTKEGGKRLAHPQERVPLGHAERDPAALGGEVRGRWAVASVRYRAPPLTDDTCVPVLSAWTWTGGGRTPGTQSASRASWRKMSCPPGLLKTTPRWRG